MSARAWKRRRSKKAWRECFSRMQRQYGADRVRMVPSGLGVEVEIVVDMPVPTRDRPVTVDYTSIWMWGGWPGEPDVIGGGKGPEEP